MKNSLLLPCKHVNNLHQAYKYQQALVKPRVLPIFDVTARWAARQYI